MPPVRTMLGTAGVPDSVDVQLSMAYWAPHLLPTIDASLRAEAFPFLPALRDTIEKVCACLRLDRQSVAG